MLEEGECLESEGVGKGFLVSALCHRAGRKSKRIKGEQEAHAAAKDKLGVAELDFLSADGYEIYGKFGADEADGAECADWGEVVDSAEMIFLKTIECHGIGETYRRHEECYGKSV